MRTTRGTRQVANGTGVLFEAIVEAFGDGTVTEAEQAEIIAGSLGLHILAERVDHRFKMGLRLLDYGDVDRDLVSQAKSLEHWCRSQKTTPTNCGFEGAEKSLRKTGERTAIENVAQLYRRVAEGEEVSSQEFKDAADAAYAAYVAADADAAAAAAAYAAYAAYVAADADADARKAARRKQAAALLRLMREAPVRVVATGG